MSCGNWSLEQYCRLKFSGMTRLPQLLLQLRSPSAILLKLPKFRSSTNIQLETSPKYQSSESKSWHVCWGSQWISARLFISQGPSFLGSCKHHSTVLHTCRSKSRGAPAQALPSQSSLFLEQFFFFPLHAYPVIIIPCTKSKHQFYSSYIPKLLDEV